MSYAPVKVALCAALLLSLVVPVAAAFTHLKLIPQVGILSLLLGSIGLGLASRGAAWGVQVLWPAISLILLFAPVVALIHGLLWIAPPITPDGHRVMAFGQVWGGAGLGALVGLLFIRHYFFRRQRDPRVDFWLVGAVTVSCAVGFLLDRVLNLI